MVVFLFFIAIILTVIGIAGFILIRNPLITIMSFVLILNAACLIFVTIDRVRDVLDGQMFALVIMAVIPIFIALGTSQIVKFYKDRPSADVDDFNSLSG